MPDYSVSFANIQSIVNRLEDPLKTELAEVARELQQELDTDLQDLQDQVQDCISRSKLLESSLDYVQKNNLELASKVIELEKKVANLEQENESLESQLSDAQARNSAY